MNRRPPRPKHTLQSTQEPEDYPASNINSPTFIEPTDQTEASEGDTEMAIATGCRSMRTKTPIERLTYAHCVETESVIHPHDVSQIIPSVEQSQPVLDFVTHAATMDPDTLYLHQARKEHDWKHFREAMRIEVNAHISNNSFVLYPREKVSDPADILPAVWAMKRNRRVAMGEVYKWKARLNIDGSKQFEGRHYNASYSPVASWDAIRILMAISLANDWKSKQIDFVQAFTQAPVERSIYMKILKGIKVKGFRNKEDYVLKIKKNIYGQVQAGKVWYTYLTNILCSIGFCKSKYDECILFKGNMVYVLYTDDTIIMGPSEDEINTCIQDMKNAKLNITVDGDMSDFLGVQFDRREKDIHISQPHLLASILKELRLGGDNTTTKEIPMASSKILSRHPDSPPFDGHFHYRRIIGMLNYLERCSRPDISYTVHQCARFCESPKREHGNAIKWLARYLKGNMNKGIVATEKDEGFVVYTDADFTGNWDRDIAQEDRDTARSRHGYIIMYAGIPVSWASQLQTEIALSSTESEYTGLSIALRKTIPLMELVQEMSDLGYPTGHTKPIIKYTLFEDNEGAAHMARVPKMRPRTRHINIKYHHFRGYVDSDKVLVESIDTEEQPADMMTKLSNATRKKKHRRKIMGW